METVDEICLDDGSDFSQDFHEYELLWTKEVIKTSVDGKTIMEVKRPENGFWDKAVKAQVWDKNLLNPWRFASKMAPFDQEFYLIINLAVGANQYSNSYFSDDCENASGKPWFNGDPFAYKNFWEAREETWLPTWDLEGENSAFQIRDIIVEEV